MLLTGIQPHQDETPHASILTSINHKLSAAFLSHEDPFRKLKPCVSRGKGNPRLQLFGLPLAVPRKFLYA